VRCVVPQHPLTASKLFYFRKIESSTKIEGPTLGNYSNLEMHCCGKFEIMERIGPFAYMLAFPTSMHVNNLFNG
jgi:hypothetical protein